MSALPPARLAHLSNYLRELVQDISAQGRIAKIEGNPVQVAAVAVLSGSIAVVEALLSDVKMLAGNAKAVAKVAAPPLAARLAGEAVAFGITKLFGGKQG